MLQTYTTASCTEKISFTSFQATNMVRLFWCSVLLFSLPVTESMEKDEGCSSKPVEEVWQNTGQSVVLWCNIKPHCLTGGQSYEWFSFREHSHGRLIPQPPKYSLEGESLHIKFLHTNDSGIYYCAAGVQGKPYVALGTTLVVREKYMVRNILLWFSFVLLAFYSLALVTLIIKKYGCRMGVSRRITKTQKNNSTKKRQFRDVLQEINSRNNLKRNKRAADHNGSPDDIYQNI
ncbi:uncharacterized protein si:ch211-139g16.8 isoform X2 [Labrus mixtus]|uniref:uncharacterized protein si:ch211-139g16.8 isoform X2 n=1 Tax=Labrus mixtus TaxID=508554 RepID=UPI0029BFB8F6|nr:uncharacterized protein si:ch211-139g16.8 isoform X2 [Labrus mixtus]